MKMRNFKIKKYLMIGVLLGALAMPVGVHAQLSPSSENPIEIEADNAIEWLRDQSQYIASGNAVAKQGDFSVKADKLIADYRETDEGKTEIWRFTALDNVVLDTGSYKAYGDEAVHLVGDEQTTLTGSNIKINGAEGSLEAKQKIVFYGKQNKAIAYGRPKAKQQKQAVEANKMTAFFKPGKAQNLDLDRIEADGDVIIVTLDEVLKGQKAIYRIEERKAVLSGDVQIIRGANILRGHEAELDVINGTSTLKANPAVPRPKTDAVGLPVTTKTKDGRVRGLFFLGGDK